MSHSHKEIILTSSPDGPITAYTTSFGHPLAWFYGSRSPRRGLTAVGKSFIAASHVSPTTASGSIHLYNFFSPTPSHDLLVPEPVAPLASSPDGTCVFAGGLSGAIHVVKIPSGDIIRSVHVHRKPVSCFGIGEDGSVLISGGDDGKLVIVPIFSLVAQKNDDDKNGTDMVLHRFRAHEGSVTAIACCGSKIISCSVDCTCKIFSLLNGSLLQTLELPCEIIGVAAVADPTKTLVYFAGSDGSIYRWSENFHGKRVPTNENHSNVIRLNCRHNTPVVSVAMADGGKTMVSAAEDGSLFFWETETEKIKTGFGENGTRSSISDMVVTPVAATSRSLGEASLNTNLFKAHELTLTEVTQNAIGLELYSRLLNGEVEQEVKLEDALVVAKRDECKAIDMLESAIAVYEKLLELLLKEVRRGSRRGDET